MSLSVDQFITNDFLSENHLNLKLMTSESFKDTSLHELNEHFVNKNKIEMNDKSYLLMIMLRHFAW